MPKFDVTIGLTIKARDRADAEGIACGACEHVLETFNDDATIKSAGLMTDRTALLRRAEAFIAGFEDDRDQQGVPELLADLRTALE